LTEAVGYTCEPENPSYWWFPSLGFSACEGISVFRERGMAAKWALRELTKKRAEIEGQIAALLAEANP